MATGSERAQGRYDQGSFPVMQRPHLAIFLDDRLSDWEEKGELLPGYFNPGDAFGRIGIVALPQDRPAAATLQLLGGAADIQFRTFGLNRLHLVLMTFGLRRFMLMRALRPLVDRLRQDRPDLIRAYGDGLAAVAAAIVGLELKIPYVVSLHSTPDPRVRGQYSSAKDRFWRWLLAPAVVWALAGAARILAVYSPILPHLPPPARRKAVVVPNVVAQSLVPYRTRPQSGADLRALWIGRLIPGRDPAPVIAALAGLPGVSLTIVGNGPLLAEARDLATSLGLQQTVTFIPSVPNPQLIEILQDFDVLVLRTEYPELAKPVMEAGLAGLPLIVNRRPSESLDEYHGYPVVFVEDDAASYAAALARLAGQTDELQRLSSRIRDVAWQRWEPAKVAARTREILQAVISDQRAGIL